MLDKYKMQHINCLVAGIFIFCVILLNAGCSSEVESSAEPNKKSVSIFQVAESEEQLESVYIGEVITNKQATLSFEIGGKLDTFPVNEGDVVSVNQLLAAIDKSDYLLQYNTAHLQYQIAQTKYQKLLNGSRNEEVEQTKKEIEILQAQLTQTQKNYIRTKQLVEEGALPPIELENTETSLQILEQQLEKAKLALTMQLNGARDEDLELQKLEMELMKNNMEQIQKNLTKTQLSAPFAGVVTKKYSEVGETVSPGKPIVDIIQTNPIYVQAEVPASILRQLELNQTVNVSIPDLQLSLEGKITKKQPIANSHTKNYAVEIEIENEQQVIFPGLLAEVELLANKQVGVWVPLQAVINRGENEPYVFVYDKQSNKVRQTQVRLSRMKGETVFIEEGLEPGDIIVTLGAAFLADGDLVQVSNATLEKGFVPKTADSEAGAQP